MEFAPSNDLSGAQVAIDRFRDKFISTCENDLLKYAMRVLTNAFSRTPVEVIANLVMLERQGCQTANPRQRLEETYFPL